MRRYDQRDVKKENRGKHTEKREGKKELMKWRKRRKRKQREEKE